ncbi:MAG: hypothetical protein Q9183_007730 [Haloplaca sp. 2 TL-2023]
MSAATSKRQAAREVIDILTEISFLLNTHLDRPTLSLCVSLIENGVNPEALAVSTRHIVAFSIIEGLNIRQTVIQELRRESEKAQSAEEQQSV